MAADVIAGRFALCDPIGSGGSGTVWRAYDLKAQRYCAAKLLRQRDAGDLLRFVREQSVRLDHPNIVSPYSWVAEDGTVLIASTLMTGGSLHTLIGDFGPLAESTVIAVLGQVLSGLQAVHDAELIHRDVKPANVLLRASGTGPLHVVLTDFGLTISRLDARLTQVGMVIGTPGYVPPEVLVGGVPPDPRHDLFAVGRLALTMIAGEEPTGRLPELIASIRDAPLRHTVQALLRHEPAERPADAAAAAELLAGGRADEVPRTRDGDPIEVLDQLPELPPGWGPSGPPAPAASVPTQVTPRATIVDVVPTAPTRADGQPRRMAEHPIPPPTPSADTGPSRRRWGWPLAAASVLVALVLGLRLLPGTTTDDPPRTPTSTTSTPGATTTPVAATTPDATTASNPSRPPSVSPTATAAVTVEPVRAGDGCSWQREGDQRTDIDGVALVCSLADGSYQWRLPG